LNPLEKYCKRGQAKTEIYWPTGKVHNFKTFLAALIIFDKEIKSGN